MPRECSYARRVRLQDAIRARAQLRHLEVSEFLTTLAVDRKVSSSTQNQALAALLFLYREVLGIPIEVGERAIRAKRGRRLPAVMTRSEVATVIAGMDGTPRLIARLLYGSGLRIEECLSLRVKDIDFAERTILVRAGKGNKDRRTVLPDNVANDLHPHLALVRRLHERDVAAGHGSVVLPGALVKKISLRSEGIGLAVGFPCAPPVRGGRYGHRAPSPPGRVGDATGGSRRGPFGRHRETCELSHLPPLVRDASSGAWVRHPDGAGAPRAHGRADDDALYARAWAWCIRGPQSRRRSVASAPLSPYPPLPAANHAG